MIVDRSKTKEARALHAQGVKALRDLFLSGVGALYAAKADDRFTGRPRRVRLRPGVPPAQTPEHKRRRKLRSIAHESRRRNRQR